MAVFASLLAVRATVRSRAALYIEILALRHPLHVQDRTVRVRLTPGDRLLWAWLSWIWTEWRASLVIVQLDTVLACTATAFVCTGP